MISALLLPDSTPRRALNFAIRRERILLAFSTLVEVYEVLNRKRFRKSVSDEDVRKFLAALIREAEWVEVHPHVRACRDPKDGKFLELAVSGKATHIVSGNSDLLTLHPFRGIHIISPRAFLDLEQATPPAL